MSPWGARPDVGHVTQGRAVGGEGGQTLQRCRVGERGRVQGSRGGRRGTGLITKTYNEMGKGRDKIKNDFHVTSHFESTLHINLF